MGALMRSIDWTATPLGPPSGWSQALCTTVGLLLRNEFPMLVWWGPEFVQFYNDAYRPIAGAKHPRSMGQRGSECWAEIWDIIGPMVEAPFRGGPASTSDDLFLLIQRKGFVEETHFKVAYSPVPDATAPRGIGGVIATVAETTEQVYGSRQLQTLRELGARAAEAKTEIEACASAAATLQENTWDVPFAMFYLLDEDGGRARLACSVGFAPGDTGSDLAPAEIDVGGLEPRAAAWPIARVLEGKRPVVLDGLRARLGGLPRGRWQEPPDTAVALPLASPDQARAYGVLIVGASPHRALDDGYRTFFELAAAQVMTAIRNARAHEAERKRAESLAELDRAKTAFFSNVSHEFRTPLTLILGPLEDLLAGQRGAIPEPARQDLEATSRNARRLLKLVNTLLDFSRLEAGRARALYEPVDLAQVTRELAGVFRSAVERAGLRLLVECPDLPAPVHVDREMWEKIVLNLLSNAFKFTFEGEIAVRLRWRDQHVELEVADTGVGIAAEELPNLFKRFHRVEAARARSHEGSGIGLALVQELVRLHGGAMTVESEPGRGTTFRATVSTGTAHLPKDETGTTRGLAPTAIAATAYVEEALRWLPGDGAQADAVAGPEAAGAPETSPSLAATAGARVLVADDNADMRDYLGRILARHWRVECVGDGAAAVAAARTRPPDVVITDVMMPVMDGFAVLRELRADPRTRQVPVVMLSARAGEEARIEGLDAGADDYLIKPFSARELVARIGSQLALASARRIVEHERSMLRSLFMQAPSPICILRGRPHVVELANPLCCELWGRTYQEVVGRPLQEAVPELASQPFQELLDRVLRTGESCVGRETRAKLGAADSTATFNFVYAPLRDANGEVEGIMVMAFDVSDEIRARDQLAQTVHYSEMFTGILAHDLRGPLAAVVTAAQLIERRSSDEQIAKPAQRILSSAGRMSRMISQLLDFTRIRLGGGISLERAPCDLEEVLRRVLGEVEGVAPGWKVVFEASGDTVGEWDADRLAQVVSNLAGNAVQHGSREAPLRVSLDGGNSATVTMTFENKGQIAPGLVPTLFEPFRGRLDHRDASRGVGLGLFITREIVGAHGGEITVTSTEETGTRFALVLPRRPAHRSAPVIPHARRGGNGNAETALLDDA